MVKPNWQREDNELRRHPPPAFWQDSADNVPLECAIGLGEMLGWRRGPVVAEGLGS
jgi:hypothetical protein